MEKHKGYPLVFLRHYEDLDEERQAVVTREDFRPAWFVIDREVEIPYSCVETDGLVCKDVGGRIYYDMEPLFFEPYTEEMYVQVGSIVK